MLQLSLALDALHEPLAFWVHYNDPQAKRDLLRRYEALPAKQRAALESAVERVFPGPTLTAYRRMKRAVLGAKESAHWLIASVER